MPLYIETEVFKKFVYIEFIVYTRAVSTPPEKIVVNGIPVFGTFTEPFTQLDIRNIVQPFGVLPLPTWITNMRIRANLTCPFVTQDYAGTIDIFDSKVFGFVELVIWERKTGKKFAYRRVLGPHRMIVPKSTENATCFSSSQKRYVRINWNDKAKRISVLFDVKGDDARPSITAAFSIDCTQNDFAKCASVVPAQVSRRCAASVQMTGSMHGSINFSGTQSSSEESSGSMMLELKRAYYPLRTKSNELFGFGTAGGKKISFRISTSNLDSKNTFNYNENVLFVDGKATLLPPVKITRTREGDCSPWNIQDTESMVDLIFRPVSDSHRMLSVLVLHTDYHTLYGNFEGTLLTNEGEALTFKGFSGIGKKLRLRY